MERRITYTSDFALRLRFRKESGEFYNLPAQDFRIYASTGGRETYSAGRIDGKLVNIYNIEGASPLMLFDSHGLATGEIHLILSVNIKDSRYPDGIRHVERHSNTGVVLVPCEGDSIAEAPEVTITVPDDIDTDAPDSPNPGNPGTEPNDPTPPEGYEAATDEEVDELLKDLLS